MFANPRIIRVVGMWEFNRERTRQRLKWMSLWLGADAGADAGAPAGASTTAAMQCVLFDSDYGLHWRTAVACGRAVDWVQNLEAFE